MIRSDALGRRNSRLDVNEECTRSGAKKNAASITAGNPRFGFIRELVDAIFGECVGIEGVARDTMRLSNALE